MWPVSVGSFSPLNTRSNLLRPVYGVNWLLEVVIFPFYNITSIKPSWALLTPSWTSAGSYWSPAMPEDKEVTGWTGKGDAMIMYPTAQLVSWRRLYSLRLIPWLPADLLLHCCKTFKFRTGKWEMGLCQCPESMFCLKKRFSCQFCTINQVRIKLSFHFKRKK